MTGNINDGFFQISKEADGVYVQVFEAQSGGNNISLEDVELELNLMDIKDFDLAPLKEQMVEGFSTITIKVTQMDQESSEAAQENMKLDISGNKFEAYVTFYPSDEEIDIEKLKDMMKTKGIVYGIDESMIEALKESREYNEAYIIATGDPVVDGEPPYIEYMFSEEKGIKPEMDEEGNVNYHQLNLISNVKKDQLLARLRPATSGQVGKTVLGETIEPRVAKPIKLKYGKNIKINEDKTEIYADCDGLVKMLDDKVIVNNCFEVPNNVGNSTGDINFDGTVIVHGNVLTGFKVKAKGDVEVIGVVEGAEIISGGNITLHKGIQGMGKSHIEAVGFVQCRYIENANVISGSDVHSEAILHSTVTCKGTVTVEGKKGMISGGTVRAGESVKTNVLGSHMGTVTTIEVGIDPLMLQEFGELKKDIPKMKSEIEKLEQVIQLLNKRKEMVGALEDDKQEMYMSAVRNKVFLNNKLVMSEKKFEDLKGQVDNKNGGYVDIVGELYTGVKISIGNMSTYVREEMKALRVEKKGADIRMVPL